MRVISGIAKGTRLNSIDEETTRPTLDRIKESLFNIIQNKIEQSIILDLFSGSGSIGIEFISRGCKKAYFCEKYAKASKMIKHNLEKTRFFDKSVLIEKDYKQCLEILKKQQVAFDIIYIDPPYKLDIAVDSVKRIMLLELLNKNGIIIIETDEPERELKQLIDLEVEVSDLRKYGRVSLLFLNRKE